MSLPEGDVIECVTQVMDGILTVGLCSTDAIFPVLGMLRSERRLSKTQVTELTHAFTGLYGALTHHLRGIRAGESNGEFNYGFHALRNDNIVLRHFRY